MLRKLRHKQKLKKQLMATLFSTGLFFIPQTTQATIREAGTEAELGTAITSAVTGDTIKLKAGSNITLTTNTIDITAGQVLAIDGNGGVLNSNGTTFKIIAAGGALNSINNITIQNGDGGGDGGAVYVHTDLGDIYNTTFKNNQTVPGDGGAVFVGDNLGNVHYSVFDNNQAGNNGGALFADTVNTVSNSSFTYNSAAVDGGAIHLHPTALTVNNYTNLDTSGNGIYFYGNTASGNPNSIHFDLSNKVYTLGVVGNGTLSMYDPMSRNGSNRLDINQASGTWILGGENFMDDTVWNINGGTFIATNDSAGNSFAIYGSGAADSFTLNAGATMLIVPTGGTIPTITIGSGNITLNGSVGLGSEPMADSSGVTIGAGQTMFTAQASVLTNAQQLTATSGVVTMGLRDIHYSNLYWDIISANLHELKVDIDRISISRSATGNYQAQASQNIALYNLNNDQIFYYLSDYFNKEKKPDLTGVRYFTKPSEVEKEETKKEDKLWGGFVTNFVHSDQRGNQAGISMNMPGLILGSPVKESKDSMVGVSLSYFWPDYKQGNSKTTANDIRLSLYGAKKYTNGLQFDWLTYVGFGNLNTTRTVTGGQYKSDPSIANYGVGLKLSKEKKIRERTFLKPFLSYEYLNTNTQSYTEETLFGPPGGAITSSSHTLNTSRIKLGLEFKHEKPTGSQFKWGLYYQGLLGDTNVSNTAFLQATPNDIVSVTSMGVDKNSLGTYLNYKKDFNKKLSMNLSYNGVIGSHTINNSFGVNLLYTF